MEYEFDTEKIIQGNKFSIEEIYNKLDNLMKQSNITEKDENNNFIGPDNNDSFINFGFNLDFQKLVKYYLTYLFK